MRPRRWSERPRGLKPAVLWPLFLLLVWGCREKSGAPTDLVRDVVERGPLKLTIEAEPRTVQVGDTVTLRLAVETPDGYEVTFPAEQDFGDLKVRQTEAPAPGPGPSGVLWRRTFALIPVSSGTLEIPALTVKYARAAGGAASQPTTALVTQPAVNELVSGPLKIEVRSALTQQDRPEKPRDITGTLLPPRPPLKPWQWGLIVGGIAGVLAAGYAAYRAIRRRMQRSPPPILPEVWALRALQELAAGDWFVTGRVREYYYRLTEIVRSYIERKFGLAAPEMTTQEFLATLARDHHTLPYDPLRLRVFLESCDIVKYAALNPRPADAEAALSTARAFVDATAAASSVGPPWPTATRGSALLRSSGTPPGPPAVDAHGGPAA